MHGGSRMSASGVKNVEIEDVKRILAGTDYLVFDARNSEEYQISHLPGSLSFPFKAKDSILKEWLAILQPEQKVLVYCSSKKCDDALNLAIFLRDYGILYVEVFLDGVEGWKNAGLPMEHE